MVEIIELDARATEIEGLFVITMKQVTDERGTVREFYRESAFVEAGLPSLGPFVQINATETRRGAVRGFHAEDMVKLVAVVAGSAFAAYVDLRRDSQSFGKTITLELGPGTQVLVPKGVGNGFQATGPDATQYLYCFDREWVPGMAGMAVTPLDADLGVSWPLPIDPDDAAQISVKDRDAPPFSDLQGAER